MPALRIRCPDIFRSSLPSRAIRRSLVICSLPSLITTSAARPVGLGSRSFRFILAEFLRFVPHQAVFSSERNQPQSLEANTEDASVSTRKQIFFRPDAPPTLRANTCGSANNCVNPLHRFRRRTIKTSQSAHVIFAWQLSNAPRDLKFEQRRKYFGRS